MSFDSAANNLVKIPIASAHSSGSGSLVLGVSGSAFPATPFRLTAITGATYGTASESLTIYSVTAVATNTPSAGQCTLTVSAIEGTTDQAYGTSDFAEMRLTAGTIQDIQSAIIPGGPGHLTVGTSGQLNLASQSAPGSPSNGDTWHDSTQHAQAWQQSGLTVYRPGLIYSQAAAVTLSSAATASLVNATGAAGTVSLPAGFLNVVGRVLRVRARGYYSTASSSQGNLTLAFYLGSSVIATNATVGQSANVANRPWQIDLDVAVKATGATGATDAYGMFLYNIGTLGVNGMPVANGTAAGTQTPTSHVTLDLTAAYTFDFQVNFSAAGNNITCTNLTLEVLG